MSLKRSYGNNESYNKKKKYDNSGRSLLHVKGFPMSLNVKDLKYLSSDIIDVWKRNTWDKYAFLEFESDEVAEMNYYLLQGAEIHGYKLIVSKDIRSDNLIPPSQRDTDSEDKEESSESIPSDLSNRSLLHVTGYPLNMDVVDLMQLSPDITYVWKRNSWDKHAFLEFNSEEIAERNYHSLQDKEIYGCKLTVSKDVSEHLISRESDTKKEKSESYNKRKHLENFRRLKEMSAHRPIEYNPTYSRKMKPETSVKCLLHVKGLLSGVNLEDLKQLSPDIICVYKQKKRDNYAFLEFQSEEIAEQNCQALQDKELHSCKLTFSKAEQGCKSSSSSEMKEENRDNEDELEEEYEGSINIDDLRCTLTVKRFPPSIGMSDLRSLSPDILNVIKVKNDLAYLEFQSEEIAKRNYFLLKRKKIRDVQLKIFLSRQTRRDWNRKERCLRFPTPVQLKMTDLPADTTIEDVKEVFPKALDPVIFKRNKDSTYGIVSFKNDFDAAEAYDAGFVTIKGEKITLSIESPTPQEKQNHLRRILVIEGYPPTTRLRTLKKLSPDIIDAKKISPNCASLEFESEKVAEGNYHFLKTKTIRRQHFQVHFKGRLSEDVQGKRKLLWFENPLQLRINYLPASTTVEDLQAVFPKAIDTQIVTNRFRFALVKFGNETDADEAYDSGIAEVNGEEVVVSYDWLIEHEKSNEEQGNTSTDDVDFEPDF